MFSELGGLMFKLIASFVFCLSASISVFANAKAEEAAALYAQRDFYHMNPAGVDKAIEAARVYQQAVDLETDFNQQLQISIDLITAHYFIGTALKEDLIQERMAAHQKAMDLSDEVISELGVEPSKASQLTQAEITNILNSLDATQELVLAQAIYNKAINLAQWGNLAGIASTLGRLPEVFGLLQRVMMMGYESIYEYGPDRTIGRIHTELPLEAGGKIELAEEHLMKAYRSTLVEGKRYSKNGYNNLFLAEALHKLGEETKAVRVLEFFINADITTLKEGNEPEHRASLKEATRLYNLWK
jgi:hypothetical protein